MTLPGSPAGFVRRLVAVILTMTATSAALIAVSAPTSAATCSSASGVSVVVDFDGVTGGVRSACVAGGGDRPADEVITSAGFALTWVQRQPGFLCRVDGVPAGDPCANTPPADAYWGLFWSDGKDGVWHYSDFGVTGLQVPDGGYIALAWQSGTRRVPGQSATAHSVVTPGPTSTPSETPTSAGSSPSSPSPSGTASPTRNPTPTQTSKPPQTGTTSGSSPTPEPAPPAPATPTATTDSASPSAELSQSSTPSNGQASPQASSSGAATSAAVDSEEAGSTTPSSSSPASSEPVVDPVDPVVPTAAETESRRVPTWLSLAVLVLLLVAIGISAMAARRRTHR